MKQCNDCIHYEVCAFHITEETDMSVFECALGFKDKLTFRLQNEWISIDDRLPEKDGKYIVHNKSGMVFQAKYYSCPKTWGMRDKGSHITHWMPMPEPPKMKGGE